MFLTKPPRQDEEEDPPEELEEGAEKSWEGYIVNEAIAPQSVIHLEGESEFLKQRVRELPEEKVMGTHWNEEGMARRLKTYKDANNSETGEPAVQDFFREHKTEVFTENAESLEGKNMKAFKIYIERLGKPFNYMTFDEEDEAARKRKNEIDEQVKRSEEENKVVREENLERELRKQKESHTKSRLEQIKEQERDLLDSRSQHIRQYLMDNVVPILTEGLIEVCKITPDDPVDHLAEYLFKRSLEVPYPDPSQY